MLRVADGLCARSQCCVIPHVLATHLHPCAAPPPTGLLLVCQSISPSVTCCLLARFTPFPLDSSAPMPYLIGVHTSLSEVNDIPHAYHYSHMLQLWIYSVFIPTKKTVSDWQRVRSRGLEEVVILNVDTNTLETPFDDHKRIPSDVVTNILCVVPLWLYAVQVCKVECSALHL